MAARRTAIVPKMIWGTAIASVIPAQLIACGGSSSESPSGDHAGSGNHAGSAGHTSENGGAAGHGEGGHSEGGHGYIVLAIGAFGGADAPGGRSGGGTGGTEVMMAGSGGHSAGMAGHSAGMAGHSAGVGGSAAGSGGSGGKKSTGTAGFFIVLAAAAFGGKNQQ